MSVFNRAEDVADLIAARLAGIKRVDGCETDIGLRVFRGLRRIEDSMVPCVSLVEGNDQVIENGRTGTVKITQRYRFEAYDRCDANDPNTQAHKMIRDLKRAIFRTDGKVDVTLGRKVIETRYVERDIGPRADGAAIVLASIDIDVSFAEDLANP